jgi:hypothetical protein
VTASTTHPRHIGVEAFCKRCPASCVSGIAMGGAWMDFGQAFVAMRSLRSGQQHLVVVMLALSSVTIDGASTFAAESSKETTRQVEGVSSLPDPALLQRQPEPACGFRGPVKQSYSR